MNRQSPSSNLSTQSATWDLGFRLERTYLLFSVQMTTLSCVSRLMSHFTEHKGGSPEPESEPRLPELCQWLEDQREMFTIEPEQLTGETASAPKLCFPYASSISGSIRRLVHRAQWNTSVLGYPWPGMFHILGHPRKHTLFFCELESRSVPGSLPRKLGAWK